MRVHSGSGVYAVATARRLPEQVDRAGSIARGMHHCAVCPRRRGALAFLRDRFDAVDPNDLAAAMAQIHVSQINPRSDINEDDLRLQTDAMLVANNAIRRAHGTPFPDEVLIPMFDNALPPAYSTIRQLVRQHNNTNFANHIQMYMSQVKAELACRQPVPHAFATFGTVLPHAPSPGGRGQGGRKGGGRFLHGG